MRNLILFACFFNFFINPVFAEFQTSEILEKIKNGRAAIYSSLDLTSEQTHEIKNLIEFFMKNCTLNYRKCLCCRRNWKGLQAAVIVR